MNLPPFTFTAPVFTGETAAVDFEGFLVVATIEADDSSGPPWENCDGHGPVSDWRHIDSKRPGERVLRSRDRYAARFYDFAEAVKVAKAEQWGPPGGRIWGESDAAAAARAAEADFERLRDWCADRWSYVGVAVTVYRHGIQLTGDYAHALWGIESDSDADHFNRTAADLAGEALDAARAAIASLVGA